MNLRAIKQAAAGDLHALAIEAGFRHVRGRLYHCAGHNDRSPSCRLYPDRLKRFCCADSLDAIDLEQLARGGSNGAAIRRLAERYGVSEVGGARTPRPGFTDAQLAAGELFRTGLVWRIEDALATLKRPLSDETRFLAAAVRSLTAQLENVQAWSSYEAAGAYATMSSTNPALAEGCVTEAIEAQEALAIALQREAA